MMTKGTTKVFAAATLAIALLVTGQAARPVSYVTCTAITTTKKG
jgi:hypothetical protein